MTDQEELAVVEAIIERCNAQTTAHEIAQQAFRIARDKFLVNVVLPDLDEATRQQIYKEIEDSVPPTTTRPSCA